MRWAASNLRPIRRHRKRWIESRCRDAIANGFERWPAWRNEPFTWAIEPGAMQDFLAAHRLRLVELALTRQFTELSGTRAAVLDGENLV